MARKPVVLSLFSGAGGIDWGLEHAGFRIGAAVEMDADACATLRANRPSMTVVERDIADVPTCDLLAAAGVRAGEVDLVVGGPPCQPFSKAGYWASGSAKRLKDPRARTLWEYFRVVEQSQPRAFLFENVAALTYRGKNEGLQHVLGLIEDINRRTGSRYMPIYATLRAADFGVPQQRDRFILVAARDGTEFEMPAATHCPAGELQLDLIASNPRRPYHTAWDALGDLEVEGDEQLKLSGKWADLLPSVPEGQNYLWHTDRGGGEPLFGWRRRYWCFLLKLAKDRPSWTLQAQPGPATGPFHWDNRLLSRRELCRLQTFPDSVDILGNHRAVQRQLGNAVPSLLAEVLGREMRRQLLDGRTWRSGLNLMPVARKTPPARPPAPVAKKYLSRVGKHLAHPGTGQGPRAVGWAE